METDQRMTNPGHVAVFITLGEQLPGNNPSKINDHINAFLKIKSKMI